MALLETLAIRLGTAVAHTACGIFLGGAADIGASAIDVASQQLQSAREQRRLGRFWQEAADVVADRLQPLIEKEFRGLPEHELQATVLAVQHTLDQAPLTEADLFSQDLDPGYLDRYLRSQDPEAVRRAGLSEAASHLYALLLRECCADAIEVVQSLPGTGMAGMVEVLRRERQILDGLRTMLERLPERRAVADFEWDYRRLTANRLDRVELFGVTLAEPNRQYPLSVAYLSLTVSGDFRITRPGERALFPVGSDPTGHGSQTTSPLARVDDVLGSTRRLFIRGQAGLGKTTLLQWIAVQSARQSFPDRLADWNDTVPFFIRLRRHAEGELPAPERFVTEVGRHIAEEMPPGWVQQQLRSGRGLVLVDGVDELTPLRREAARNWLRELIEAFPHARYVVTSRPAAAEPNWLRGDDFDVAELEPMDRDDVRMFVSRWHDAMREQCERTEQRERLTRYEQHLLDSLTSQRHLRTLAGFPLLCALLCALHVDRHGELPRNRMELYEVALQMLLERRDRERHIRWGPAVGRTELTLLLRHIAYWLIDNGWSSAAADRVRDQIARKLAGMSQITADANEVYRVLLERTGLLREPAEGQTDFVHRTFQEYLAAQEAVASDNIGALIRHADADLWSEVVVLAAGHATSKQRVELLSGLLHRASSWLQDGSIRQGDSLRLVAVACLETSPELPPDLRKKVQDAVRSLLPPKDMTAARTLARTGAFTVDLLARTNPRRAAEVAATIRAASEIGDPAALPLLARFGQDGRKRVVKELLHAWPKFDPEEYARTVLKNYPLDDGWFQVDDRRLIPGLRHLRNLRTLRVTPYHPTPLDLSFVHDLPHLRDLSFGDTADLAPLTGCQITHLIQGAEGLSARDPLSLEPVAQLPTLRHLAILGRRVTSLTTLSRLPELVFLWLRQLETIDALLEVASLSHLTWCGFGGMPDLRNLEPIKFLDGPVDLEITTCPTLQDVSALDQWSNSLSSVALRFCPAVDLDTVPDLPLLRSLDLSGSEGLDLRLILRLPNLERLMVGYGELPDLRPLHDAPALRNLIVWGVPEVDLSPLRGRQNLTVDVWDHMSVHGAELLGPGSRVVRM